MAYVVIKDNHLKFGGISYFRANSLNVELGSIGEKRSPLTGQNYLEVKDRIPVGHIEGVKSIITEIDTTTLSKTDIATQVSAIVMVSGVPVPTSLTADAAFEKIKANQLKLVLFSAMGNDMMKATNQSPEKLDFLKKWGNDARIAYQVFVVMDATLSSQFANSANVNLGIGVDKVLTASVGVDTHKTGTTTVKLAPGTCFAYLLAKIDWNKAKDAIEDLNDDQWG